MLSLGVCRRGATFKNRGGFRCLKPRLLLLQVRLLKLHVAVLHCLATVHKA